MEEDRSALFDQLRGFSQRNLKKVQTKVVTPLGESLIEKRDASGLQVVKKTLIPDSTAETPTDPSKQQQATTTTTETPRAPSPNAALREAKLQQAASKLIGQQQTNDSSPSSTEAPKVCGQLSRSSSKKLLNLIKTKNKADLTLSDGDENDEIEALLGALEDESIDKLMWMSLDETKDNNNE